jgi:hypothetical protein
MDAQRNRYPGDQPIPAHQTGAEPLLDDEALARILRPYPKGSGSASTPYQRDTVVEALSSMQRHALSDDTRLDAEAISAALKLALYNAGASDASQIVDNERSVVDFVSRIFQTIFEDGLLSEPVKTLLSKLQVPVIKLALIDFEFFQNASHPARKLLNGLVALGIGITSKDEPLLAHLAAIVSGVIEHFDADIAPLEDAYKQLLRLHEVEAEQIRKIEARFQREARIEARRLAAKRKVIGTLNRNMQNVQLPDEVTTFILKVWAPYMAQTYLRQGLESEAWLSATKTLREMVAAAKEGRAPGLASPFASAEAHFDRLRATLEQAGCYKGAQVDCTQRARAWFAERSRASAQVSGVEPPSAGIEPSFEEEAEVSQTSIRLSNLLAKVPPKVKPGAWFEIYRGEGKAKRRLKLSAVLEDIGRLLFADRTGRGVLEVELEGFLRDLSEGRTKLINDDDRFDHALSLVIDGIRQNQSKQEIVINV